MGTSRWWIVEYEVLMLLDIFDGKKLGTFYSFEIWEMCCLISSSAV